MTKPNRDYLLATISSLRSAHDYLSNYIDSGANDEHDRLKNADIEICRLAHFLYGRPELDDFRKHLKPVPWPAP